MSTPYGNVVMLIAFIYTNFHGTNLIDMVTLIISGHL